MDVAQMPTNAQQQQQQQHIIKKQQHNIKKQQQQQHQQLYIRIEFQPLLVKLNTPASTTTPMTL
jgi:hypothetical protein